jgi:RIO-like serine/threonine protein kinase
MYATKEQRDWVSESIGANYQDKESSGKSTIAVTPDKAAKMFIGSTSEKIQNEVDAVEVVNSKYIAEILDYSAQHMVIVYETLIPLPSIATYKTRDLRTFTDLICNISCAMFDIHGAGYAHGDVAEGNIGLSKRGTFVLYDNEDLREANPMQMYADVKMFLDDLSRVYRKFEEQTTIIEKLREMVDEHIQITMVERRFGTRMRSVEDRSNLDFDHTTFGKCVNELLTCESC